jgi:hypothetical protein
VSLEVLLLLSEVLFLFHTDGRIFLELLLLQLIFNQR